LAFLLSDELLELKLQRNRVFQEALSRDPMSGLLNVGLAFVLLETRKFDESIEQARTASEVDPEMVLCYWILGTAYEKKGMYPQAIEAYEKSIDLGGGVGFSKAFISHAYATAGQLSKAWEAVGELQELSKTRYVPWTALVIAYDGLREMDLAMKALNKACENRETNLVLLKVWPHFDNVRHDPRFQEIERRVGLRSS
jgi:tetratricopeptide (TPR) repeat protein